MHPLKEIISYTKILYCGVEQLVARWAHNPKATGSSPVPATKSKALEIGLFCYVLRLRTILQSPQQNVRGVLA